MEKKTKSSPEVDLEAMRALVMDVLVKDMGVPPNPKVVDDVVEQLLGDPVQFELFRESE